MIVVKRFWTSTSFDPEKKRDKRSWPISFNLAIRNKGKAWEEIVSSFDSHSTRLTFANIHFFSDGQAFLYIVPSGTCKPWTNSKSTCAG